MTEVEEEYEITHYGFSIAELKTESKNGNVLVNRIPI